jgi:chromosomal replication initiator protein
VPVEDDVLSFLAHHVTDSIRTLEGCLTRLKAHALLEGQPVPLSRARDLLSDVVGTATLHYTVERITRGVANHYDLDADQLAGRSRKRLVVSARHVAMYFCHQLTEKSLQSIGLAFGGRDHSTVSYALKKVSDRLDVEDAFESELKSARRAIDAAA